MVAKKTTAKKETTKKEEAPVELPKPFTKPFEELSFEELASLEGVLMAEINWLGEKCLDYRNQAQTVYSNRLGTPLGGHDSMKEAEFAVNRQHDRLVALCTRVHNKLVNYILDKWA